MKRLPLFSLLVIVSLSVHAETSPQVSELLTRMQTALQNLNYHGILVYLHEGEMQSMRIVHKADKNGEVEHVVNLNGAGREVFRRNDVVTCVIPERKVVMVGRRQDSGNVLSKIANNDFLALRDNYDFKVAAEGRVAGLDTERVDIIPRDNYRYGYHLWLDDDSKLLLRSDLVDDDGNLLEQAMFVDVHIVDNIPDSMLKPVTRNDDFSWYREQNQLAMPPLVESHWQLGQLPAGFEVTGRYRHPLPETTEPAEHLVVSDGMASVSIYIERLHDERDRFEGASSMGVMNVFGALISGHQITVIGDVPGITVEKIAHAVTLQPVDNDK